MRDEYQSSFILNGVVWPYDSGEVTVQNYNATLTLAKIYDHSDGVRRPPLGALSGLVPCAGLSRRQSASESAMTRGRPAATADRSGSAVFALATDFRIGCRLSWSATTTSAGRALVQMLGIKSPSFMNLNQMISHHLASVLLPVSRQESWCVHDTVVSSILEVCHRLHWAPQPLHACIARPCGASQQSRHSKDSCSNFVRTLRTGC